MLQAILLDVDGTLAKTQVMHRRAFHSAFTERGMNVDGSAPEYRELLKVTGGKERIAAYVDSRAAALSEPQIRALHHAVAIAIDDSPAGIAAARDAGIAVVATPGLYIDGGDFPRADCVLPHLGDPDPPREAAVLGCARRWVQISDLQRLAATWEITPRTELAQ
jgi:beta-phosphoglucomutase-like phosphatase (HAD superfamily)